MKTLITTAALTLALTSTTLFASGSHSHSHDGGHGHSHTKAVVSKKDIATTAKQELSRLVEGEKIERSWADSTVKGMKKKQFHNSIEWVVSFENSAVEDKDKQTLYIFVSLYGKVTAANFTGN